MPLIDDSGRMILTSAPGTGSTSLIAAFADRPHVRRVPEADIAAADGQQLLDAKHATVAQLIEHRLIKSNHQCSIITTVRNPFDFYVAEWSRSRTRWVRELRDRNSWVHRQSGALERIVDAVTMDFDPWLEAALQPHLRSGGIRHLNPGHIAEADVVLRMEHLQDDAARFGVAIAVPHLNSSGRSAPYWTSYSVDARRWVETVHRPDLDRFGYRF
jgi:hypothetical protein